jgi:hypothetical protein
MWSAAAADGFRSGNSHIIYPHAPAMALDKGRIVEHSTTLVGEISPLHSRPLPFEDLVAARKWQTLTDRRITHVGTNRLDSLHC